MKSLLILFFFQILSLSLFSQEILNDLFVNPALVNKALNTSPQKSTALLNLPFFDDFSTPTSYPSQELWENKMVYVNTNYGILPPSIGVATFDAVNAQGFIYESLFDKPSPADTLTSRLIDMSAADVNTTYLSFYYQPQGNGDDPEFNDSIVLNILVKDTVYRLWHANGTDYKSFKYDSLKIPKDRPDTLEFKLVHLKMDHPDFYTGPIQLQFINYVSLPGLYAASGRTNKDHWHIDYLMLDKNRSAGDTIFEDMAMVQPSSLFMKDYSSVPWSHFPAAIVGQLSDVAFSVRNNGSKLRSLNQLVLNITDINKGTVADFYIGQKDMYPYENRSDILWGFSKQPFEWYDAESAEFEISGEIKTDENDPAGNNFTLRRVSYMDYYAYDDGSAEKAYGVDSERAKVAYRYDIYKGDSLRAVQMYFVRNKEESAGVQSFTFCIWDDYNNTPGNIILKVSGLRPEFSDELNGFVTIPLDSVIYLEGKFYIGWEQNSDLLMNVGYDANTNRVNRLFYNVNSAWYASDFNGSLMMRPVFGKAQTGTGMADKRSMEPLMLAPNPSKGIVTFTPADSFEPGTIRIYNYLGNKIMEKAINLSQTLNVNYLVNGVYIITFTSEMGKVKSTRLIISK